MPIVPNMARSLAGRYHEDRRDRATRAEPNDLENVKTEDHQGKSEAEDEKAPQERRENPWEAPRASSKAIYLYKIQPEQWDKLDKKQKEEKAPFDPYSSERATDWRKSSGGSKKKTSKQKASKEAPE